ncbi:MAG: glutathione synthase [Azoarcus sp.]|uniref:Glutathione synthetase n=1 Tax=Aromatoleum tolulyticum TaxID=34027 RepID=A0A1N6NHN3_9RHOO|nr:glutathione synthase [Aromatoleum tolulyticum]MCK9988165.1 glutathione synthase [Azoarcus sp.]SIP91589.1 glutathione synthase [Aromatoleum tolulyticum]
MTDRLRIAFIVDPLDRLKAYKDSSIAMMREAHARGHAVFAIRREALTWRDGVVSARALAIRPTADDHAWYLPGEEAVLPLTAFDAVLMRQDPPFDFEYVTATWMLERAVAGGARVFNDPRAIRDHSEKLAICEFPQFAPTTLIARDGADVHAFIDELGDVILKPLDGMGGSQIFRVRADDPNRNVIVETLTHEGVRTIMAQRFLPQIAEGDKRVLIVGGEVVPYSLARIPKAGETRGNLAAGGRGVAMPLTEREREVAEYLAPVLWGRGLLIVGLDMIGGQLTEINVTSPTCFVEIAEQSGFSVAALLVDMLEEACAR